MDEEFYTVKEIAAKLKLTPKGVYDLMKDGRLGYVQIGARKRRVSHAQLRQFLTSHQRHGLGTEEDSGYTQGHIRTPMQAVA